MKALLFAPLLLVQVASPQRLVLTPNTITLPRGPGQIFVDDAAGGHLKFKYTGAVNPVVGGPAAYNFVVVIPSTGVTSETVLIGLNSSVLPYLRPGGLYPAVVQFATVDVTPASMTGVTVNLLAPSEPAPAIQAVVNATSSQPALSPGELVSIMGSHLTGPTLSTNYDDTASYPTSVASTSVTFNGIAAPLVYVSPAQINAIVPFALAGQSSVQIAVQRFEQVSAAFSVPLQDTSPGIFTATQNGSGQGAILQLAAGAFTYNGQGNPASAGQTVEIFATGAGVWTPAAQSDVFLYGETFTT